MRAAWLTAALALASLATAAEPAWVTVFHESFETGRPGEPVGAPWVQRHAVRQVRVTDAAAAEGKHAAFFRYEVAAEGSLDAEAGAFGIEAPFARPDDAPAVWRISAALRCRPEVWTAAALMVRGEHWRPAVSLVNSMRTFFLGGLDTVVWHPGEPDRWYRVTMVLREAERSFDLDIGEDGDPWRNRFERLPLPPESLPIKKLAFAYVGALVRYGQGRESYLDDVRVERAE